jgi:hypothetical protein
LCLCTARGERQKKNALRNKKDWALLVFDKHVTAAPSTKVRMLEIIDELCEYHVTWGNMCMK